MGILVLEKHVDRMDIDINDVGVNVYMGEHKDKPTVAIREEGTPATTTPASTSTSKLLGIYCTSSPHYCCYNYNYKGYRSTPFVLIEPSNATGYDYCLPYYY